MKLKSYTVQMAIVYLDKLISKFDVSKIHKQIYLWATTLLLISSKFNEIEAEVPYIDDFKKASPKVKYSYNSVVR